MHEALLKKSADGETKPKTMKDYIHLGRMEQVRDSCRTAHGASMQEGDADVAEEHVARYNELAGQLDELVADAQTGRAECDDRSAVVVSEFEEGIAKLQLASGHAERLVAMWDEDARRGAHERREQGKVDVQIFWSSTKQ